ncbi:MAG: Rieske (2Fe-2S) protein [Thaumarchaeota archaeon]|nr:Rieske (2Fe-2S) protein [Nitrososphaerota archaeon]
MTTWAKLIGADELTEGSGKAVPVGNLVVAVFKVDGKFFALENRCLHRQGPLGEGELEGRTVVCPWHGWRYDVASGSLELMPTLKVGKYAIEVRGDDVFIGIPESNREEE